MSPDGVFNGAFGYSVSLDGDTALIGAFSDNDNGSRSGSAYVFVRSGTTWTQQAKLLAADGTFNDIFGYSVSLDGDTALIGAPGDDLQNPTTSAYVFVRSGSSWFQQSKLTSTLNNPANGYKSDQMVSLDGDVALIGVYHDNTATGSAYAFVRSGLSWTQQAILSASDGGLGDQFGRSLSVDNNTILIGAPGYDIIDPIFNAEHGIAYIFSFDGTVVIPPIRGYPADGELLTNDNSSSWPRFIFQQMGGAEWYQIWIGSDDYTQTALFQWYEAAQICEAGVCTIPTDIWLSNGDYEWWFNYWGPNFQTLDYWNATTFSVDFAAPSSTFTLTNPADGATITSAPSTIEWARDTNVLWYQVWVGTDDYVNTIAFNWYDATEICDATTCTLDVSGASFPAGGYEVWAEMWGPNGYVTWPAMPNATFTLEPSAPPAQPGPSRR